MDSKACIKQKRKRKKRYGRKSIKSISLDKPLYRDYFISNKEFTDSFIKPSLSNYKEIEVDDVLLLSLSNYLLIDYTNTSW